MDIKDAKEQLKDFYANEEELKEAIKSDNISDAITELADSNVDIYYYDIYKSIQNDGIVEAIENARDEGLINEKTTLDKQIQIGQFYQNTQVLYEALEELEEELKI
jgi:hypothetical protein